MSDARRADQDLARVAHEILPGEVSGELRTRMRQLPSRLRGGGLAATYAFVLSKARNNTGDEVAYAYHQLAKAIAQHVAGRRFLHGAPLTMNPTQFLDKLACATPPEYARTAAEIDALAVWLSRLADALYRRPERPAEGDDRGQG